MQRDCISSSEPGSVNPDGSRGSKPSEPTSRGGCPVFMQCRQRDAAALGLRTGFAWLTGLAESGSERMRRKKAAKESCKRKTGRSENRHIHAIMWSSVSPLFSVRGFRLNRQVGRHPHVNSSFSNPWSPAVHWCPTPAGWGRGGFGLFASPADTKWTRFDGEVDTQNCVFSEISMV